MAVTPKYSTVRDNAHEGGKLSRNQAALLEQKADADPADIDSRVSLLGYYHRTSLLSWSGFISVVIRNKSNNDERYLSLIRWFVENHPNRPEAGLIEMCPPYGLDASVLQDLEELWTKKIEEHPGDVVVLSNAASFFHHAARNFSKSEDLIRQAQELDPDNPYWPGRLSQLDRLRAKSRPELVASALSKKEDEIEKSERVNPYDLGDLAELAFAVGDYDKAKTAAEHLLALATADRDCARSDYGNGIHDGNSILGRIAVRDGDIGTAEQFLGKASRSPGSPSLNSFGPDMDLAQDLLDRGKRRSVLNYLWHCHRFWNGIHGTPFILLWTALISIGMKPRLNSVHTLPESKVTGLLM
jgi:tetratricopeptide (TPR) repeat protein